MRYTTANRTLAPRRRHSLNQAMGRLYDLIAIGGGSAGLSVAERAAHYGARVLLVEADRLGGTCVNRGCVPKKLMWYAAYIGQAVHDAAHYGFRVHFAGHDWHGLKAARDRYVQRLNEYYETYLRDSKVSWVKGHARLAGPRTVEVAGRAYEAEHVVVATGSHPVVPEVPGARWGITSDGVFALDARPDRVAVVGGGYIAVELAGVMAALGSEVVMMLRARQDFLTTFDEMLRESMLAELQGNGVEVIFDAPLDRVERSDDGSLAVCRDDDSRLSGFDTLLWATGRIPNTAGLGLEAVGVATDAIGAIVTDEYQRSSVAGVYAIGDVTGRAPLTPVAIAAGRRLARRLFGGEPNCHLDYDLIPTVVFGLPPLGTVGLTERQATEKYGEEAVNVYQSSFVPLYHALSDSSARAAVKLVTVGPEQTVVGCHLIGPGADEILQGFAVAIQMGARKVDLDNTLAIHPTLAEELVTLR